MALAAQDSSRGIVETLEFFRSEISQFDSTNLAATPAGNKMRNQLTAKAAEFVGAQDILSNDAELNWRGVLGRAIIPGGIKRKSLI